ncbi:hypothetical protein PAPYR_13184 [Paratrimastix pyriformis]|uniref:Uncharacterized protein n=1 Tax=Paratrimastix pyriformis TaxID=342808 RepID=A0ABQ8U332_9EUKA|nr:hypothetical protein PAPYR_13184 [Paratrimastix pyriformis]
MPRRVLSADDMDDPTATMAKTPSRGQTFSTFFSASRKSWKAGSWGVVDLHDLTIANSMHLGGEYCGLGPGRCPASTAPYYPVRSAVGPVEPPKDRWVLDGLYSRLDFAQAASRTACCASHSDWASWTGTEGSPDTSEKLTHFLTQNGPSPRCVRQRIAHRQCSDHRQAHRTAAFGGAAAFAAASNDWLVARQVLAQTTAKLLVCNFPSPCHKLRLRQSADHHTWRATCFAELGPTEVGGLACWDARGGRHLLQKGIEGAGFPRTTAVNSTATSCRVTRGILWAWARHRQCQPRRSAQTARYAEAGRRAASHCPARQHRGTLPKCAAVQQTGSAMDAPCVIQGEYQFDQQPARESGVVLLIKSITHKDNILDISGLLFVANCTGSLLLFPNATDALFHLNACFVPSNLRPHWLALDPPGVRFRTLS